MKRPSGFLVRVALAAIRAYQRHLSPHKGFNCAYRRATGRDGCSGYGARMIGRFGLMAGLALLRRRLRLCGQTHRRRPVVPNPILYYQRGDCDVPCDADCLDCAGDCSCNPLERYLDEKWRNARYRWRRWRERRRER